MKMKDDMRAVIEHLDKEPEISIHDEVCTVRNWLLEVDEGSKLSPEQIKALDNAISDRMRGYITGEQFVKIVDLPQSKSGVGLSTHRAKMISEKLESFLDSDYDKNTGKTGLSGK
jgi:hypothetical protein